MILKKRPGSKHNPSPIRKKYEWENRKGRTEERRSRFMILYQIAKTMEQRAQLDRTIRENGAGSEVLDQLLAEKAELEQALLARAAIRAEADPALSV